MINDQLVLIPGSEFLGADRMQVMMPFFEDDGTKKYLIGTFSLGAFIYDGKTFKKFQADADSDFREYNMYKGLAVSKTQYAIATAGAGLYIIDNKGKTQLHLTKASGLPDDLVYDLCLDHNQNLWLGMDYGIARVELNKPFSYFKALQGVSSTTLFTTRFEDKIYTATSTGLLRLNPATGIFESVRGLPSGQTFNLLADGKELLITSNGLFRLKNNQVQTVKKSVSGDFGVLNFRKSQVNKNLLFVGISGGAVVFYRDYNTPDASWEFIGKIPEINEDIWTLSEDKDLPGKIWLGTQSPVSYRLSFPVTGKPSLKALKVEEIVTLPAALKLQGLITTIRGNTLFGGDSGYYQFDEKTKTFFIDPDIGKFNRGGGILELMISEDSRHRIWVRIGKEFRIYTPGPKGYTIDSTSLQSVFQETIAEIFHDRDSITWISTLNGVVRYDEKLTSGSLKNFPVYIRFVSNGSHQMNPDPQADSGRIHFPYKNNALRFEYASPFYDQESLLKYQTKLEGYDDDWSSLDNNSYKEYTNLSPGSYTFKVRAQNVYGKLSEEAGYTFLILSPWYLTWWAIALYAIAAIGIVYLLVRWRTRHLHDQHRELEKIVHERTAQLSQRVEELAVINSVQESLVREKDMDAIYKMVGEKIREIFNAQVIDIVTYDPATNIIEDRYAYEKGDTTLLAPRQLQGFRKQVAETNETLLINRNLLEVARKENFSALIGEVPKSLVIVPMIANNKVNGMISLQDLDKENAFTDYDVHLLKTLANSMSVALESATRFNETRRLLKETEQRNAELGVINSVQEGFVSDLNMQGIFDLVGEKVREIFNVQVIDIVMYDKKDNTIEDRYSYEKGDTTLLGKRPLQGIRKEVARTSETLVINNNIEEYFEKYDHIVLYGEKPKSIVIVPMISNNAVIGMISLQDLDHENKFSDSDVSLLKTLANSMTVALESARRYDETKHLLRETEQRNAELGVINSVQEGFVSDLNMQGIFDLVGEKVREIFNAQVIDIVMYYKEDNTIEDRYSYEKGDTTLLGRRPLQGLRKGVAETSEPMVLNTNVLETAKQYNHTVLIGEVPQSVVIVPMISNNTVIGMISLQDLDKENAFSESDVSLLKTLANSMSVALESARRFDETKHLLKETEQRNAELAVINSVQDGLVAQLNIQSIYDLVGEKIREIFNAQVIDIVTYDPKNNTIEDRYAYEKGDRTLIAPREPKGFRKHVIQTKQLLLHNENVAEESIRFGNPLIIGEIPKSQVFVPMIAGGDIKGIISLQNLDRENAFRESDVRLLTTLANSISVALENARLFDETKHLLKETEQRNAELAVINSVQDGLVREMNMQGIFDLVGEKIRAIFNAQVIDIVMYDKDTGLIEDRYAYEKGDRSLIGPRQPSGFRKHIIQSLQPLFINTNYEEIAKKYNNEIIFGEAPKSAALMPLIAGNEVKGIISLQNLDRENAFSESDHSLLTTLSNSMSVALESARLFDETTRLLNETEQRNAELAVINSVQEGLVAQLNIQSIYDLVGEKIREIFNAQVIDIVTYDQRKNTIEDRYSFEKGDRTLLGPREPKGFRKHVIDTKQLMLHNEKVIEETARYGNPLLIGDIPKSQVFVPMIAGGEIKGIISLQSLDREHAFRESDVRLLTTLANSMSVALENARLFDETKRLLLETEQRTAELGVINVVQEGLVREIDANAIYNLVGEKMREIFNAQVIDIVTYDKSSNIIEDKYAFEKGDRSILPPREPYGYRKHVIETRQMLLLNSDTEKHAAYYGNKVILGEMTKSVVFVPLLEGNEVKGIVSLQNIDQENAFSDSDVRLLVTLANSLSIALQNAKLFDETKRLLKETEQRTAELAVINTVQEGLVREMNAESIYEMVGEKMREVFNAQVVDIVTYDKNANIIEDRYAYEKGDRTILPPRQPYGIRKHIIESKQLMVINDSMREVEKKFKNPVYAGQGAKSAIFVPLMEGNDVTGIVSLQNLDEENAFSDSNVKMLVTLSSSLSIALQNARLFDETNRLLAEAKQRSSELSTVNNVSKTLASQLNPDELIARVGGQMKELFNANIVYLALLNDKTKTIYFPYQYGDNLVPMKLGEGLTSQILITGEPLLLNSESAGVTTSLGFQRVGIPAASYLGVPIPDGDKIIGVLSVQSTEQENRFNENDQRLLSTIAASVGVALRNARLFEEVKLAKLEAETATKIAEKANEAKSAFLSTVSHELRTPLTSVLGFAKIIRKRLEEKIFPQTNQSDPKTGKVIQQVSENLNVVVAEGERLTHLINDVLDLAKIEAGKMEWSEEWVSISEIVERAASATSALFDQKNLHLERNYSVDLPDIRGDRDKLIQVVVNLLSNAVKFTESGTVTCKVSRTEQEIIVDITDTGIGIAAEDHSAVFEQFRQVGDTLTDKPKGTGLGLPICKEIVEHHGGTIWLESAPGKGSTFSFSIPLQPLDNQKPLPLNDLVAQLKEQMAQSRLNSKTATSTILIVDDDDSIRSLLYQELSDAGYLIEEATNGKEALVKIRANRPDLVILDVMMPEMNGFDVAAVLKNDPQTLDIPIIVLSIVQDKARGFRIGVDRYLTKPIDTGILFNEVDSLLQQGKSRKKVLVVDEDQNTVRTLVDVLKSKGYHVVESDGKELVAKALDTQPDIIILNSLISEKTDLSQSLRMEKGMENVLFLVYQ